MRKILLVLLTSVTGLQAQNFEGIIQWKMAMEITDPKVKAQMEEAEKRMSDPKAQAQMKEMQEKMNDPQFKAMMESNPQMKEQLERAISMVQGGGGVSSMIPKGYTVKIKNQNSMVTMDGGMMANSGFLYLKDKNASYQLDFENKTYRLLPPATDEHKSDVETKVTKSGETQRILDFTCTKYIVDVTTHGNTIQQFFWTTTAIKDLDFKSFGQQRMGNNQQMMFYDKVEGVPLKIEMFTPQGRMVMEATEITKKPLPSSDFEIPGGFKEASH